MAFFLYFFYRGFTTILTPFFYIFLFYRLIKGKENKISYQEKCAIRMKNIDGRPVWLHAASVGELNSAIPLINLLQEKSSVLVTTSTLTSGQIFHSKLGNEKKIHHVFLPLDNIFFIKKFLKFYRPKAAIFVESEIWPNFIVETAKVCPMVSVNTRFSPSSLKKWSKFPYLLKFFFNKFTAIFPSSQNLTEKLQLMKIENVKYIGNLKCDFVFKGEIPENSKEKEHFKKTIVLVASTHRGEEKLLLPLLKKLASVSNISPIILPRHPERGGEIKNLVESYGLTVSLRSRNERGGAIYIADTLGESYLFYYISNIIFIGGSLMQNIGGHNILEPAFFKKSVVTGPFYANFESIIEEMKKEKAIFIAEANNIENTIFFLLSENAVLRETGEKAYSFLMERKGISIKLAEIITAL